MLCWNEALSSAAADHVTKFNQLMGHGAGQVVIVLAFYSDDV